MGAAHPGGILRPCGAPGAKAVQGEQPPAGADDPSLAGAKAEGPARAVGIVRQEAVSRDDQGARRGPQGDLWF